jgi:HEAT repeat protein
MPPSAVDEFERLIQRYRARSSTASRLEVLMDLEYLGDSRIVAFLIQVLADGREIRDVRIHALKSLRDGYLTPEDRPRVAATMRQVLTDGSALELRLHAALALAEFSDVDGIQAALGGLALDHDEPIDLRYGAFTSLEKAGLNVKSIALLEQLAADKVLGPCARNALSSWRYLPDDRSG